MDLFARAAEKAFGQGNLLRPRLHSWFAEAEPVRAPVDESVEEAPIEGEDETSATVAPATRRRMPRREEPAPAALPRSEPRPEPAPVPPRGAEVTIETGAVELTGSPEPAAPTQPESDLPDEVRQPVRRRKRGATTRPLETARAHRVDDLAAPQITTEAHHPAHPRVEPTSVAARAAAATKTSFRAPARAQPAVAPRVEVSETPEDTVPLLAPPFPAPAMVLGPGVVQAPPARPNATEESGEAVTGPTIEVTIGRVEVRAVTAARPPARQSPKPAERLSLDEYLRQRPGGRT